jgi:hypothetical protein
MATPTNRTKSLRFRELVALALRADGLPVAVKPEPPRRVSEFFLEDREQGDIQGLSDWAINTRNEIHFDWSGALNEAARDAEHDGKKNAALIQMRRDSSIGQAFVVMTFDTFSRVLRDELDRSRAHE